jgi:perosamine synthetase
VGAFEEAFAARIGSVVAVAVSSGTAALHAAVHAAGIGPGDEVIVPAMTFAASANCVLYVGATPVFADVDPETLLIDPDAVRASITPRTRAIIAVDYAGQPCDYDELRAVAAQHGLQLIADACHAVGGSYRGTAVGALADLSVFSFHPVKHLTTAEGGMVTTVDPELASRLRVFRNHGITTDHAQRARAGSFHYEMVELGFNYRLNDVQCALGLSQLKKLPEFLARRREIAARYDESLASHRAVTPLASRGDRQHAYHLYVVQVDADALGRTRSEAFAALRAENIGVNVHYVPVHLHPYYRRHLGTGPGLCPVAESAYERILSLPMFADMSNADVDDVVRAFEKLAAARLVRQ